MADIERELRTILEAVYGEEVRSSIHDAIYAINAGLENWETGVDTKVDNFIARLNGIIEQSGDLLEGDIAANLANAVMALNQRSSIIDEYGNVKTIQNAGRAAQYSVYSQTTGEELKFGSNDDHTVFGLWSNGYSPDGSTFVSDAKWILSRGIDGSVQLIGNAATATKLAASRSITIGDQTRSFDGTENISFDLTGMGIAAASHGNHVPTVQSANNAIFLRNDNTWQIVTPANIGAAASSHLHDDRYLKLSGGTLTDNAFVVKDNNSYFAAKSSASGLVAYLCVGSNKIDHGLYSNGYSTNGTSLSSSGMWMVYRNSAGTVILNGNATGSASKLATARTIKVGAKANSFDGSANIEFTLSDIGAAAASHGNHVPATQAANNAIYLRNDNTWQTITPAKIGAAAASHGNHVPTTQTANNAIYLRNDNTWQTITPAKIGAAASSHTHSPNDIKGDGYIWAEINITAVKRQPLSSYDYTNHSYPTGGNGIWYHTICTPQVNGQRISHLAVPASGTKKLLVTGEKTASHTWETWNVTFASSDIRLKENVQPTEVKDALAVIKALKVRSFDWKDSGKHQRIGFVADEMQEVDEDFATGGGYDDDGLMNVKSVDTLYLLAYLTKAVQQLSDMIGGQNK